MCKTDSGGVHIVGVVVGGCHCIWCFINSAEGDLIAHSGQVQNPPAKALTIILWKPALLSMTLITGWNINKKMDFQRCTIK